MKVKDLIEKLKECDQNATVIVTSSNYELRGARVEASGPHQYNEGIRKVETFTDDFDYEDYSKEVWSIVGGKEPVVVIS